MIGEPALQSNLNPEDFVDVFGWAFSWLGTLRYDSIRARSNVMLGISSAEP
jgi:hypothetical protein